MNKGRTVFSQLIEHLPLSEFHRCVNRYKGNRYVKKFSCLDQYLCMAFAQLTFRESLRDIETCLNAVQHKLYHSGIRSAVSRSTLADANESRDWRIFADFAHALIDIARTLYHDEPFAVELEETVYALDATTIDLCLSLFPWANFRKHKGAIRLHTLLNIRGNIPSFLKITTGKIHEVNILDELFFEAGAFYLLDRGYVDFARLYAIHQHRASFIIRAKSNLQFRRIYSHPVDKATGICCDQTIMLATNRSLQDYPEQFRRVKFYDTDNDRYLVLLTNNVTIAALTVAQLFKCRWQIELFFKWIKQHLRIKAFYGISENAVKTQIWIAISVYVLVAIIRKRLKLQASLYTILQILSVTLFEKSDINQLLTETSIIPEQPIAQNQLNLFDF
ncbi:IS4 family transposase [bacterium]|nr:IS4 family transposase [bacterium]